MQSCMCPAVMTMSVARKPLFRYHADKIDVNEIKMPWKSKQFACIEMMCMRRRGWDDDAELPSLRRRFKHQQLRSIDGAKEGCNFCRQLKTRTHTHTSATPLSDVRWMARTLITKLPFNSSMLRHFALGDIFERVRSWNGNRDRTVRSTAIAQTWSECEMKRKKKTKKKQKIETIHLKFAMNIDW